MLSVAEDICCGLILHPLLHILYKGNSDLLIIIRSSCRYFYCNLRRFFVEKSRTNTERLIVTAIMIALSVILTRFAGITTPLIRLSFGYLPIVIVAIQYGPVWAGVAYTIADLLGSFIFPSGAFFPGFTLSACLTGVVYGLFLYRREVNLKNIIIAVIVVELGINLLINTYWLTIMLGKGYMALFPARLIKNLICIQLIPFLFSR